MQKAYHHTRVSRQKMSSSALLIRGTEKDENRLRSLPRKENHWNWGGDSVSKLAFHKRLHRWYGKASVYKCVDCGGRARDWSNEKRVYSSDMNDYKPRCRSCHVKKDKNWIKS